MVAGLQPGPVAYPDANPPSIHRYVLRGYRAFSPINNQNPRNYRIFSSVAFFPHVKTRMKELRYSMNVPHHLGFLTLLRLVHSTTDGKCHSPRPAALGTFSFQLSQSRPPVGGAYVAVLTKRECDCFGHGASHFTRFPHKSFRVSCLTNGPHADTGTAFMFAKFWNVDLYPRAQGCLYYIKQMLRAS